VGLRLEFGSADTPMNELVVDCYPSFVERDTEGDSFFPAIASTILYHYILLFLEQKTVSLQLPVFVTLVWPA
jgi:hypothetical protein